MTIRPNRLNRVTTHPVNSHQTKGRWCQRLLRVFVKIAHDIHLAFASRAGTAPPQCLQLDVTLRAVVPSDRQFVPDWLNVQRFHLLFFKPRSKAASVSGLTWCSIPSASISAVRSEMPKDLKKATTVSCRCLHSSASLWPASVRKIAR